MKVGIDGILLGAWAAIENCKKLLDIGTGCGLLAIMAAQRNTDALITGVEIDLPTAEEAKLNALDCPWSDRITILGQSIQDYAMETNETFDAIISNPPFYTRGTLSSSQSRQAVRHTTKLSHHDLLGAVRKLLSPKGEFHLVLPPLEGLRLVEIAQAHGLYVQRSTEVYPAAGKPVERLLITLCRYPSPLHKEIIKMRVGHNLYSEQFKDLTADFYL
ncbi:MAG: methyltransferase [Saprospiraceae bacterium]|nr:methyltransferase [Saprospiraceae bacterium]